jgi:hypothetical protein
MSDRSHLLSGFSVGVAVFGSAVGSLALSLAGPLLGLLIHMWNQHSAIKEGRDKSELVDHLKTRIFQLEMELATAKGIVITPPKREP